MRKTQLLLLMCLIFIGQVQSAFAQNNSPKDDPPLTVTATKSGDDVIVSWTSSSKSATYDIVRAKTNATGTEIISEETLATGISETQYTDNTWQNENVGGYYKWGVKYSEAKGNRQEIIIGDGTEQTNLVPFNTVAEYSLTQQIYTSSEIGVTGNISSISFYISETYSGSRNIAVYMKCTETATFSSNTSWISLTSSDKVFEGSVNISNTGWLTINLSEPFNYQSGNLLVCVDDNTCSAVGSCKFNATNISNSAIYMWRYSFMGNPNPLNPPAGTVYSYRPNLKLVIDGSVQQTYWSNVLHNKWYSVSIKEGIQNGTISTNATYAQVGQTIVITSNPDEDYHLESLYYYPNDNVTNITNIDMSTMDFAMPADDITINAEFAKDLVAYNIYVKDILDNPIEGAKVTIYNSGSSYSAYTTFQGWATLHIPDGSYNYTVSKEGYYDGTGSCEATNFEVTLSEKHDSPSHFYVSATGWAMWSPFYNGSKEIIGYKLRTADAWGEVESIDVTTPYYQFDVSKYWEGYVYNVYVTTVYTGNVVSEIPNNTEWLYYPCRYYNSVNNYLAEISDENIILTWTAPAQNANHTLLGYMVWRNNVLLTQEILGASVNSYADNSEEASSSATYCVKAVYDDEQYDEDEYNVHFCMSCGSTMVPNEAYHWNGNEYQYLNGITVTAVIKINDEEQRSSALEVGAFCGDQCRGTKRAIHFANTDKFIATFNVNGKDGEKIKFRLYDHGQGEELEYKCKTNFTFKSDTLIGNAEDPYEIKFYSAVTQNQDLAAGNNWYSTYVTLDGKAGLQLIETELGTSANNIKSQTAYTTFVNNSSWFGSLTEANNSEMYAINMASSKSLSVRGASVEPSETPITTHQGWNWIGYPVEEGLAVNTALASLNASDEDIIKSKSQQSQYGANGWAGELTTMTPGQGYMYYQTAEGTKTFTYPTPESKDKSLNDNVKDKDRHWNPDIHKYAMNMSVAATISIDGEVQNNENLEVGAFCNGEVRGSAHPIFYEPLNEYVVMLTVHGEDNDNIVFKLYDSATNVEYKSFANETLKYSDNGIVGSLSTPYNISFSSSNENNCVNFYPNPTERGKDITLPFVSEKVEIFNTIGAKIAEYQNVGVIKGLDAAGTYIIRVTDGTNVRYGKLIVE